MSNQDLLEHAYALAESGSVRSLYELRTMLAKEGYTHAETAQIDPRDFGEATECQN
jgi:hypothetical protein